MTSWNSSMSVWADGSVNMTSWTISSDEKIKLEEQKKKVWEIIKSLESELKTIRESITKENIEEMKIKAEELKATYLAKVSEAFPNVDEAKKVIENRFKIFFNNQFNVREQVKEIKEKAKETASGALNQAKESAKNAIEKIRESKKIENTQVREENKQIKTDLKAKYKEKYIKALKSKLDNLPKEKLQAIYDKIKIKRDYIATKTWLKETTREKYLAQIDALLEILNEKINPSTSEELDVEQILDEASSSN